MKLKIYFLTMLFFVSLTTLAQSYEVSGVVTDDDNDPLPAVSVIVKGTTNGTSSDFDGNYSLSVSQGDVLVYSFVGFNSKEVTMDGTTTVDVVLASGVALDEVVVVGSRAPARTAVDSAVPVDVIDISELITAGPQVNLNQILNYVAPSFSSNTQTISDGTDHIDPASLRGLGPDQVLVLINGKRRHSSSLVNVNGTFGRGSVGTDLNAIPAAAISRIEVLRDGAAAQYGSDAIAGVINIVLKKATNELSVNVTTGANFSKNSNSQTGGTDGETTNVSANYGLDLGENGGFINFTGDFDYRNDYNRMKEWEGGIFNAYNSVEWVARQSGMDLANMSFSDIQLAAQGVTHFDIATKNAVNNATTIDQLRAALDFDTTENELAVRGQSRTDYNMRVGQSGLRSGRFMANLSLPVDDQGTELYAFGGLGSRNGNSAGFYRLPSQSRAYTPLYINGFLPEINSKIKDKSLAIGIRGKVNEWNVDFSNTWGKNSFLFEISNTSNASLQAKSPLRFDAGGFNFVQNTTNLDINHHYEDIMNGLNVAFGGEYRTETYEIEAGEEASWQLYGADGDPVGAGVPDVTDFYGNTRPAGSQVFPGYRPENELSRDRNSIAGYLDLELDVTEKWLVTGAFRYENYSDFGSTANYKFATRYKVTENVNIRGAINTGFRAPSLHQLNFNSTSTLFVNGLPNEVLTASNDSQLAKEFGIEQLKEEQSFSSSIGITAKLPESNMKITLDGYYVAIEDRIGLTGQFKSTGVGTVIGDALADAGAERVSFFANAVDTETYGLDFVVTHKANFGKNMRLTSDFAATFSKTRQVDDVHYPQPIVDAGLQGVFFDEATKLNLEEAVPRVKLNLSNNLKINDKINIFLRNVFFGTVTNAENNSYADAAKTILTTFRQQEYDPKIVTDLSVGYQVTDMINLTIGANNLLDVYPDKSIDAIRSGGRFDWSRRAQQFGIGGRFLFARLSLNLK